MAREVRRLAMTTTLPIDEEGAVSSGSSSSVKHQHLGRPFDYLIVESTGVSLPLPVSAAFGLDDVATGGSLSEAVRIDSLVTVVDAERFVANILEAVSCCWHPKIFTA